MGSLIRAEYIKGRRSFSRKSFVVFPLLVALLAIALMGGRFTQIGAYNWWYMMFLPACVALLCNGLITPEKQLQFFNVDILPIPRARLWLAKVCVGCGYLFAANCTVFVFTTMSGAVFGAQYAVWRGISAALVLTVTWAWQIPVGMLISARFSPVLTFLGILSANVLCSFQTIAGGDWWFIPFAIPARLMASILGVNPNGVPMTSDSPLHDTSVLLPGLLITATLFGFSLLLTTKWFKRRRA